MNVTPRTAAQIIENIRRLGRAMADETMPDADWNAIKRERDAWQAELDQVQAVGQ